MNRLRGRFTRKAFLKVYRNDHEFMVRAEARNNHNFMVAVHRKNHDFMIGAKYRKDLKKHGCGEAHRNHYPYGVYSAVANAPVTCGYGRGPRSAVVPPTPHMTVTKMIFNSTLAR